MITELCGPPGVGKSTLAKELGCLPHAQVSQASWCEGPYAALRSFVARTHEGHPRLARHLDDTLAHIGRAALLDRLGQDCVLDESLFQRGNLMACLGMPRETLKQWYDLLPVEGWVYRLLEADSATIVARGQQRKREGGKPGLDRKMVDRAVAAADMAAGWLIDRGAAVERRDDGSPSDGMRRAAMTSTSNVLQIAGLLRERTCFAFSRWGDGEWSCLLKAGKRNCDGHIYTDALRSALEGVLFAHPKYLLGLQSHALSRTHEDGGPWEEHVSAWLAQRGLWLDWCDADILHRASARGRLGVFTDALAGRRVILVGPERLRALDLFPVGHFVTVPDQQCHRKIARVHRDIRCVATPGSVVLISASMSANVLVHRLHAKMPDVTLIDCGSVWEPYIGHANRTYHRRVLERLR